MQIKVSRNKDVVQANSLMDHSEYRPYSPNCHIGMIDLPSSALALEELLFSL